MQLPRLGSTKFRYLIVGAWNTLFGIALFAVLLKYFENGLGYIGVLSVATPVAVVQSHLSQRIFVWKSNAEYKSELLRFGLVYFAQYLSNLALLFVAVDIFHFDVLASQVSIAIGLVAVTFIVNKRWTFKS